jgi:hypothetical protein
MDNILSNAKRLQGYLYEKTGKEVLIVKQGTSMVAVWAKDNKLNLYNFGYAVIYVIEDEQIEELITLLKK